VIDKKTKDLMRKAKWRKEDKKDKQKKLYQTGKKQGGKYTHDINAPGNTVSGKTIRKRKMQELEEKRKRKRILAMIKEVKDAKNKNNNKRK
tara:strand:+ start:505 stop:777 length:273 start_codon:yes stop_codon:yes gene_type:complete